MEKLQADARLLVSPREAAKLLSVSPRKLWEMTFAEIPGLPYLKIGRLVRYSLSDLEGWIHAQRQCSHECSVARDG